jgi:hypothetical protein
MGKLITPSILNSFEWLRNCPPSWSAKALKDAKSALLRRFTSTKATQQGIRFENEIYSALTNDAMAESNDLIVDKFLEVCRAGDFQAKYTKDVIVDGVTYTLYGKLDVDLPKVVLDLKTTKNYKQGKYLATPQHLIYCFLTGKKEFEYHVCEWRKGEDGEPLEDKEGNYIPGAHFVEEYKVEDWGDVKRTIAQKIRAFRQSLKDYEMEDLYLDYFVKNKKG